MGTPKGKPKPLNWVVLSGDPRDPWETCACYGVFQYKMHADQFAMETMRRDSFHAVRVLRIYRPQLTSDLSGYGRNGPEG